MPSLGRYELLGPFTGHGTSKTFLALQKGFGAFRKLVMVRELMPELNRGGTKDPRVLEDVQTAAGFSHPNIAQVYDLEAHEGGLVLATEYVPGATLAELVDACKEEKRRFPLGCLLMACRDTALAMHYAHSFKDALGRPRPVIYRTLKAGNILISYEGITRVLDFGVPRAPRALKDPPIDVMVDIAAVGTVLNDALETVDKEPSPALYAAISRCNPDAANRFPDARELARALESAASALVWKPDAAAALVQELFAERRAELQTLMEQVHGREHTAVMSLSSIFKRPVLPKVAEAPEPTVTPIEPLPPPVPKESEDFEEPMTEVALLDPAAKRARANLASESATVKPGALRVADMFAAGTGEELTDPTAVPGGRLGGSRRQGTEETGELEVKEEARAAHRSSERTRPPVDEEDTQPPQPPVARPGVAAPAGKRSAALQSGVAKAQRDDDGRRGAAHQSGVGKAQSDSERRGGYEEERRIAALHSGMGRAQGDDEGYRSDEGRRGGHEEGRRNVAQHSGTGRAQSDDEGHRSDEGRRGGHDDGQRHGHDENRRGGHDDGRRNVAQHSGTGHDEGHRSDEGRRGGHDDGRRSPVLHSGVGRAQNDDEGRRSPVLHSGVGRAQSDDDGRRGGRNEDDGQRGGHEDGQRHGSEDHRRGGRGAALHSGVAKAQSDDGSEGDRGRRLPSGPVTVVPPGDDPEFRGAPTRVLSPGEEVALPPLRTPPRPHTPPASPSPSPGGRRGALRSNPVSTGPSMNARLVALGLVLLPVFGLLFWMVNRQAVRRAVPGLARLIEGPPPAELSTEPRDGSDDAAPFRRVEGAPAPAPTPRDAGVGRPEEDEGMVVLPPPKPDAPPPPQKPKHHR